MIVAMPPGERHGLGVAMLADILSQAGYEVRNLGPDTPSASLVAAIREAGPLAAIVVSVVDGERRRAAGRSSAPRTGNGRPFRAWPAEMRYRTSAWRSSSGRPDGSRIHEGLATSSKPYRARAR